METNLLFTLLIVCLNAAKVLNSNIIIIIIIIIITVFLSCDCRIMSYRCRDHWRLQPSLFHSGGRYFCWSSLDLGSCHCRHRGETRPTSLSQLAIAGGKPKSNELHDRRQRRR